MKKIINTLLATAAVVAVSTSAFADASAGTAKTAHGAYLGASAGVAMTNVKYNRLAGGTFTIENGDTSPAQAYAANNGKSAGLFGVVAGYNFQSGSVVFGGEIYGGFDATNVTILNDTGSAAGTDSAIYGNLTVKRKSYIGFAPRVGFMVAPNTLAYVRLGVEAGKWKANLAPNSNGLTSNASFDPVAKANTASSNQTFASSKGGISFAPGVGVEVYMGKVFLRAQYSYLFGPKVTIVQNTTGISSTVYDGSQATHTMKITQHKVEFAVGYKF